MSCSKTLQDLKIAEKVAQDNYEAAKKQEEEAQAALDLATDAEKQRNAGSILFVISGAGLVSKCRFHSRCRGGPTRVVPHTTRWQ